MSNTRWLVFTDLHRVFMGRVPCAMSHLVIQHEAYLESQRRIDMCYQINSF